MNIGISGKILNKSSINKILCNNKAGDILSFSIIKYEPERDIYVIDLKSTKLSLNENAKIYIPQSKKETVTYDNINNNENRIWNIGNTSSFNIPLNGTSLLNNSMIKPNIKEMDKSPLIIRSNLSFK